MNLACLNIPKLTRGLLHSDDLYNKIYTNINIKGGGGHHLFNR